MTAYQLSLFAEILIQALMALSVYVVLATGQLALGNAGFMAIGAYAASYGTVALGWPIPISIAVGAGCAALIGLIIGIPALRLTGIYLAMATFGFGIVVQSIFLVTPLTGGVRGYFGMPTVSYLEMTLWAVALFAVVGWAYRSRLWLRLRAIHDDEFAATMTGLNTTVLKVGSFVVGGAIAGVSGGIFAHYFTYIEPGNFGFLVSIYAVLAVILGGRHSVWGAIVGAMLLTLLPEYTRFVGDWRPASVGVLLLLMLVFRPGGIIGGRLRIPAGLRSVLAARG